METTIEAKSTKEVILRFETEELRMDGDEVRIIEWVAWSIAFADGRTEWLKSTDDENELSLEIIIRE